MKRISNKWVYLGKRKEKNRTANWPGDTAAAGFNLQVKVTQKFNATLDGSAFPSLNSQRQLSGLKKEERNEHTSVTGEKMDSNFL